MKKYVLTLSEANLAFVRELLKGKTFSLSGRCNDLEYADGSADPWRDNANENICPILDKYSHFRIREPNPEYFFLHGKFDREGHDYFFYDEGYRVRGFAGVKYATPAVPTRVFLDGYYNVIVIYSREHSIRAMFSKYFL